MAHEMFFHIKEECSQDIKVPCDPLDLDFDWEKIKIKLESTCDPRTTDDLQFFIDYELKREFKPELKNLLDPAAGLWRMKSEDLIISNVELSDPKDITVPPDDNQEEVAVDSELIVYASPLSSLTENPLEEHTIDQNLLDEGTNLQHYKRGKESKQKDSLARQVSNHNGKEQLERPTRQKRPALKLREMLELQSMIKRPAKRVTSPLKCNLCGKEFKHRTTMTKHIWTGKDCLPQLKSMTPEESLVAKETVETVNEPSDQEKHIMKHKGEMDNLVAAKSPRPTDQETVLICYKCKGCDAWFTKKDLLLKHGKKHKSKMKTLKITKISSNLGDKGTVLNSHKCKLCGMEFKIRGALNKHIWTGKDCLPQLKSTAGEESLVAKEPVKTMNRPSGQETFSEWHKCKFCDARFTKKNLLLKHGKKHKIRMETLKRRKISSKLGDKGTVLNSLKCKLCGMEFKFRGALTEHIWTGKDCHPQLKPTIPEESFVAKEPVKTMNRPSGQETVLECHKCKVCDAEFTNKDLLMKHGMKHKSNMDILETTEIPSTPDDKGTVLNSHKCKFCGKKYQMEGHLINHILKHKVGTNDIDKETLEIMNKRRRRRRGKGSLFQATTPQTHKCKFCEADFIERAQLVEHMLGHKAERMFACALCPKRFMEKRVLAVHMLSHSSLQPFNCHTCGQGFKQKSNLKVHMVIHEGKKRFKCSTCQLHFMHKSNLKVHMAIHSNLRPHTCVLCGKSYKKKGHLKEHVLSHTGEKPFQCSVCLKRFVRKCILKVHILSHSGLSKPHECETCGKQFTSSDILIRHLLSHTGVKTFKCEICERLFMYESDFKSHMFLDHTK